MVQFSSLRRRDGSKPPNGHISASTGGYRLVTARRRAVRVRHAVQTRCLPASIGMHSTWLLGDALVEVERVAPRVVAERRQLLLLLSPPGGGALRHELVRHGLPPQLGTCGPRLLRGTALLALERPVVQPARRRRPRQREAEAAEALLHELVVARRRRLRHRRLVHEAGHGTVIWQCPTEQSGSSGEGGL
jgi:hypothetical protein